MDGSFVNWADAHVHVMTHSLHYGLAVFEGIRCYKGKSGSAIFRLQEHVDRLFDSTHIGMMKMPFDKKQVAEAIVETKISLDELCQDWMPAPHLLKGVRVEKKIPLEQLPAIQSKMAEIDHVLTGRGRMVVRYSGTEPLLRVMMEGPDESKLKELSGRIADQARRVLGGSAPSPLRS